MFEHPYFLAVYLLLLLFLVFRGRRYFLKHAYVQPMKSLKPSTGWWDRAKVVCNSLGWLVLVLAAANFLLGYKETVRKQAVHKYVLINDASGSMVDSRKERGIGEALTAVTAGNKALLDRLAKRSDGGKDLVAATVFDNETYVVSYLVDDPQFVQQKLDNISYNQPPLGGGTQLDKALWGGIEVVANHEDLLEPEELRAMRVRMFGAGTSFHKDDVIEKLIKKCLPVTEGASLVIFTDGVFANPQGSFHQMSGFKLLQLCKELKIRVYMISVERIEPNVLRYLKDTGGDGIVRRSYDPEAFRQIYEDIVNSQAQETVVVEQDAKKSLGTICGFIAATLLLTGFLISQTVNRKYTEI